MSVLLLLAHLSLTTFAISNQASAPHVQVQLLTEQDALAPGSPFSAGLRFILEPHWHIYWQYPGDSGQTPQVQWTLPAGFSAEPIAWPLPRRLPVGGLMNYGYEDEVLLPVAMQSPAAWPSDNAGIDIVANVHWLVCAELCIPGSAVLRTTLARGAATHLHSEAAPRFAAARMALPTPLPSTWQAPHGEIDSKSITLHFDAAATPTPTAAQFFPAVGLQIDNAAEPLFTPTAHGFDLRLARSDQLADGLTQLAGVLVAQSAGSAAGYKVNVPLQPANSVSLAWVLLLALGGGIILNLMPCVFPVLSIKVISLAQMSGQDRHRIRLYAWLYTLGVMVTFWALTGALLALRQLGQQIGWGFQLQSPAFVAGLAALMFTLGLNLLGTFEMGNSLTGAGQSLANRGGAWGAFFTGVLATVVATPCTAPFMGTAVGFALSQPAAVCLLVFSALGAGLALPYLLVCYIPGIGRIMPRPGRWMDTLRQLMAFPILGTVVWLVWVLGLQTGMGGVAALLAGLLLLSLGAWMMGRWGDRRPVLLLAAAVMAAGAGAGIWQASESRAPTAAAATGALVHGAGDLDWQAYSPARLAALRQEGRPVFIDFTAAWCVSCQVNEAMVFGSAEVRGKIKQLNMALLRADWTSQDPVITQALAGFGRSGVPLYVLYGHSQEAPAVRLPEVITAGLVLDELNKLQ